ncbi:MAG: CPBP family intramembrane metalloprotease [Spirochaetes bacterium]|nr:CPBP family intramembrane metalloprotease [Spirochaetota bacterium]
MEIIDYILRIIPGFVLFTIFIIMVPRGMKGLRIMGYIMLFILVRDAMTPLGFWSFGTGEGFWIRFAPNGPLLALLGISSVALALGIYFYEGGMRSMIQWFSRGKCIGAVAGIASAFLITAPLLVMYLGVPMESRGGPFPVSLIPALIAMTMGGNLYEELLFRGYFQGYLLENNMGPAPAAFLSGIAFGFGHVFLASTVTSAGLPLLLFATWEGIILGFVRMRYGVIPAALGHGGAIFILASALAP